MENSEWLDLFESKVEKNLLNDLVKAKTEFATKTRSLKLIEPLDLQSEENKSDSRQLIAKMTDFAKEANLDVETIMQEQCNDTVMIDIKNCLKQNEKPERNKKNLYRKEKKSKAYIRQFKLLFIEDQRDLRCINEYNDDYTKSPKICLPISLVLNCFELAHKHPLSGHHDETKILEIFKRYSYWPGLYRWVNMLVHDCLECQKNQPKRKDLIEASLQQWA